MNGFIKFENVKKQYKMGEVIINALHDISFEVEKGEFCVIVGPSGAGKTTILNLLGGMDTVSGGDIYVDSNHISCFSNYFLTLYRRDDVGFVFQFYNLIQNLNALENVELASQICKRPLDPQKTLCEVGLSDRLYNFPSQLSGGEQQRVAIARALAKNPKLLLCDEPIGALDYQTGKSILELLWNSCQKSGKTVIVVTHNQALTAMADRVIKVSSGNIVSNQRNPAPKKAQDIEW
ncbi:MAG: ABC transporter ATP-binding protein [Christensenellales bacterium]